MDRIPPEVALRIIDQLLADRVWKSPGSASGEGPAPVIHERRKDVQNALVALLRTNQFWNELVSPYLVDHLVIHHGTDRLVQAMLYRIPTVDERRLVRTLSLDLGVSIRHEWPSELSIHLDRMFASFVRNLPNVRVLTAVRHGDVNRDHAFLDLAKAVAEREELSGLTFDRLGWPFLSVAITGQQDSLRSLELRGCDLDEAGIAVIGSCTALETLALSDCDLGRRAPQPGVKLKAPLRHLFVKMPEKHPPNSFMSPIELFRFLLPDHVRLHTLSLHSGIPHAALADDPLFQRPSLWSELRRLRLGGGGGGASTSPLGLCARMSPRHLQTLTLDEDPKELAVLMSGLIKAVWRPPELEIARPQEDCWRRYRYTPEQRDALVRACEQVGTTLFWLH